MRRPTLLCLALALSVILAAPPAARSAKVILKPLKFFQVTQLFGTSWRTPATIGSEAGGTLQVFDAPLKLDPGVTVTGLSYWHSAGTGGGTLVKVLYADETTGFESEVGMFEAGSAEVTFDNFTPIRVTGEAKPEDKVIRKGRKYMVRVNCNPDSFVWKVVVTYSK